MAYGFAVPFHFEVIGANGLLLWEQDIVVGYSGTGSEQDREAIVDDDGREHLLHDKPCPWDAQLTDRHGKNRKITIPETK